MTHRNEPSTGDPPSPEQRLRSVLDFWEWFDVANGNAVETTCGGLDDVRAEVRELQRHDPPDLTRLEGLTAYAALLISGETLY